MGNGLNGTMISVWILCCAFDGAAKAPSPRRRETASPGEGEHSIFQCNGSSRMMCTYLRSVFNGTLLE